MRCSNATTSWAAFFAARFLRMVQKTKTRNSNVQTLLDEASMSQMFLAKSNLIEKRWLVLNLPL